MTRHADDLGTDSMSFTDQPAEAAPAYPTESTASDAAPNQTTGSSFGSGSVAQPSTDAPTSLVEDGSVEDFTTRWHDVQVMFVDEPKRAVEQADMLVADVMRSVAAGFTAEKGRLEERWATGGDVATEDLRQALQRYRSFFERLLAA